MDELQLTWNGKKLYLWGVSSHTDEQFTPEERLKKIIGILFPYKTSLCFLKQNIEIPAIGNTIVVPYALKLAYGQYIDMQKAIPKKIQINAIEIELRELIDGFLLSRKQNSFYFGDSYEGYKHIVKFAYNLVVRQRFTPYYKGDRSFFLANFDS